MSVATQKSPEKSQVNETEVEEPIESLNPKLQKVMQMLLNSKFLLQSNEYLNLLATYLTNDEDSKLTPQELVAKKRLLEAWVKEFVVVNEKMKEPPSPVLMTFALNVTQYLCKTEQMFIDLNNEDFFEQLIKIVNKIDQSNVITGCIKLYSNFLDHKSGTQWIISTKHWKCIFNVVLNDPNIYAFKEGYTFIAKLMQKSFEINHLFCKCLISYILKPMDEILKTVSSKQITKSNDKNVLSALRLLGEILLLLTRSESSVGGDAVITMCTEHFKLEKTAKQIIGVTDNSELKGALYRIIIFLGLHALKLKLAEWTELVVDKTDQSCTVMDTLYEAANVISVSSMLQLLFSTLSCWSDIKKQLPQCVKISIIFEDQLLAVQLMPMYTIFVKTIGYNVYTSDNKDDDNVRYMFISKLVDRIYPKTVRVKYKWQNYLLDNYSINNGILSLKFFIHSKQFYSKENAVLIFQMMMYLLGDLITTIQEKPELQYQFVNDPEYLELHLKVIGIIIEEFKLTFRDTLESLCVLYVVFQLINGMIWPTKIVVAALKLAEIGISKYMTFQLSLFIEDSEGCLMREIPGLLRGKLHDGAWEVRDSAIELLQAFFISIANKKDCTAYKKLLLENDLPRSILEMGTHDGNPFVRASALKCVQKVIDIPEFWNDLTKSCDIFKTVMNVLKVETEGIVRYEAVALIDYICEIKEIPENVSNDFFDTMSHAVVADLHWEVRVKAMSFWKKIIDDYLTQQGLIDGCFPSVTFSKDLRKIVTLNSVEIKKCLVKVLYKLSEIGCLFVFYDTLKDDCDIKVSKCAADTIKDFVNLLKEHNVTVECLQQYRPLKSCQSSSCVTSSALSAINENQSANIQSPSIQISDDILEDILNTQDLNLLETVYNSTDTPVLEHIETKKRQIIEPELFLNLVYSDLDSRFGNETALVQQTKDFQSLLDDILKKYEFDDVNSMDCY